MELLEFRDKFVEDANSLLITLEKDLMSLEKDNQNMELIQSVFRIMHTLKGVSSMYGFDNISELTHNLESIFDLVKDAKLKLNTDVLDITLQSCDHIKQLLRDAEGENPTNQANHAKILSTIDVLLKSENKTIRKFKTKAVAKESANISTYNILFYPNETIFIRNINLVNLFSDLFALGEFDIVNPNIEEQNEYWSIFLVTDKPLSEIEMSIYFILDDCKITKVGDFDIFDEQETKKRIKETEESEPTFFKTLQITDSVGTPMNLDNLTDNNVIRENYFQDNHITVNTKKLDKLMYLVSELITTNSQLSLQSRNKAYAPIRQQLEKIDVLSKQFRQNALDIRLVAIKDLTFRFQRLIRDLSKQLGKDINFIAQGDETELDKNTIDALTEPLMHLIRNCIDHGIEYPEERKSNGKTSVGIIKMTAYHSGNFIFIQIQDDGCGINPDTIYKKAVEKGFVEAGTNLSETEIYELIFLPGFSTAQKLTEVSGRGLGMDIVKNRINRLRGEVEINSEIGLGTSFTIKLQQSLSIMDTLLIKVGNSFFLIPIDEVEVCGQEFHEVIVEKHNSQILFKEEMVPFIYLRKAFNMKSEIQEKEKIVFVKNQNLRFAIVTDSIIGKYQAVIKPVGEMFKYQDFIAGASVMGNGQIAVMLDTKKLMSKI